MSIIEFIIFALLWIPIDYLCLKWAIKHNKELFYDLYRKQIERELKKK